MTQYSQSKHDSPIFSSYLVFFRFTFITKPDPLLSKAQSKDSYTCITHNFYSILTRIAHKFYARSQCSVSHKMSLVNALRTKLSFLQVYFLSNIHLFSYISILSFICLLPANCEHFVFVCETGHIACFVSIYFINFIFFCYIFYFPQEM